MRLAESSYSKQKTHTHIYIFQEVLDSLIIAQSKKEGGMNTPKNNKIINVSKRMNGINGNK